MTSGCVVVKIGSGALSGGRAGLDPAVLRRLAADVADARAAGRDVVLVSSGAILAGRERLKLAARPSTQLKQAAAAVGQSRLMRAWEAAFARRKLTVAQVLLTREDLQDRGRYLNARNTLLTLLRLGVVPIVNENDTVAVEEIKFGDNDQLAAMVAPLVEADLVLLLSDVAGLLDGSGRRISIVRDVATEALPHVRASKGGVGTGGMASKIEAARRATLAGANVVVADARAAGIVEAVLSGKDVGTLFVGARERLSAKKSWIAFTLRPRGDVVLDAGAAEAVRAKGKSVLSVGVLGVRGDFRAGDAVRLLDAAGRELARGLSRCTATEAAAVAGKARAELPPALADHGVIVHADELVVGGHTF